MLLDKSTCLKFYKQKEVQNALIEHAQRKEIGVRYSETFGKRPDILQYPKEILALALNGATSLHCSEELWSNPMELSSASSKQDQAELRVGWDLVLDVDCSFLEYSQICTDLIVHFLRYCDVGSISVKFSGNKGFHVGVPFEAFPEQVGSMCTKDLFPDAARKIASYVKENIKETLGKRILELEHNDFAAVKVKVGLPDSDLIRYRTNEWGEKIPTLNVEKFLEIDTVLISPRHLYRMPYSLHEKSGLVSLPIDPSEILSFDKRSARPENTHKLWLPPRPFLERDLGVGSARRLLLQALDFEAKIPAVAEAAAKQKQYEEVSITRPITEEFFPPCMKQICNGLEDGKKRALFCLINYLGKIGWNREQIDEYVHKWNTEKNRVPLREVYIKGQLAHFRPGERLPPNCDNEAYYSSIGTLCNPHDHCLKFKNPVNYTLYRWRKYLQQQQENEATGTRKGSKKRSTEETKAIPSSPATPSDSHDGTPLKE